MSRIPEVYSDPLLDVIELHQGDEPLTQRQVMSRAGGLLDWLFRCRCKWCSDTREIQELPRAEVVR